MKLGDEDLHLLSHLYKLALHNSRPASPASQWEGQGALSRERSEIAERVLQAQEVSVPKLEKWEVITVTSLRHHRFLSALLNSLQYGNWRVLDLERPLSTESVHSTASCQG